MNRIDIFSDKETYELHININKIYINELLKETKAVVIDENVYELYKMTYNFNISTLIFIDAKEYKKTPEFALKLCEQLMLKGVKRKDKIIALGGGITQDLVTFSTSILYRGIKWIWLPTTLLAQADSCIGGKSSLNYKSWKNIIGNFYPPSQIIIQSDFLKTLKEDDIRSGIGEIIKVHLLSGKKSIEYIISKLENYKHNKDIMSEIIFNSLKLKNKILEIDPLDQGLRLKMNYGHSFGHALEASTNFAISHGIAVTVGIDMANYLALKLNKLSSSEFNLLHNFIISNLKEKDYISFEFDDFITALKRDKKNDNQNYNLIIPISFGEVEITSLPIDDKSEKLFQNYFQEYYNDRT